MVTVLARVLILLAPQALMAIVPEWAVGWSAPMVGLGGLLGRVPLAPRNNGMRLIQPWGAC